MRIHQLHNFLPSILNSSPISTSFGKGICRWQWKTSRERATDEAGAWCMLQLVANSTGQPQNYCENKGRQTWRRAEDTANQEIFGIVRMSVELKISNVSYNQRNSDVLSKCSCKAFLLRGIHTWPRRAWQGCRMLSQRWHCSNAHHAQPLLSRDPATPGSISEAQKGKRNEALQNRLKEKLLCDQETPF